MVFYVFVRKKNRVTTAIMLNVDDTVNVEDVIMIFDELEAQNSTL